MIDFGALTYVCNKISLTHTDFMQIFRYFWRISFSNVKIEAVHHFGLQTSVKQYVNFNACAPTSDCLSRSCLRFALSIQAALWLCVVG